MWIDLFLTFEQVFMTIGVLFVRVITFGKYPSLHIKERFKVLYAVIGLLFSTAILVLVAEIFF